MSLINVRASINSRGHPGCWCTIVSAHTEGGKSFTSCFSWVPLFPEVIHMHHLNNPYNGCVRIVGATIPILQIWGEVDKCLFALGHRTNLWLRRDKPGIAWLTLLATKWHQLSVSQFAYNLASIFVLSKASWVSGWHLSMKYSELSIWSYSYKTYLCASHVVLVDSQLCTCFLSPASVGTDLIFWCLKWSDTKSSMVGEEVCLYGQICLL